MHADGQFRPQWPAQQQQSDINDPNENPGIAAGVLHFSDIRLNGRT
jgi:hypothetical protein